MPEKALRLVAMLAVVVGTASCQTYRPLELKPASVLEEVVASRSRPLEPSDLLTLGQAAVMMDAHNPNLALLREAYESQRRVASLKTPLPNPTIGFGPVFGSRLEETSASATQPFVSLGLAFPLGPRLQRNDELNDVLAVQAYNRTVAAHREMYFQLRRSYVEAANAQRVLKAHEALQASFADTREATKRLVELGSISSLGILGTQLQSAEIEAERLELAMVQSGAKAALAAVIAVAEEQIRERSVAPLPEVAPLLPERSELAERMLANNITLAGLEMDLQVRNAELRLELARQYPDVSVGLAAENEAGERKRTWSLPIGVELPVFDRNRQAIQTAENARALAASGYRAELANHLAKLDRLHAQVVLLDEKLALFVTKILPVAQKNVDDGHKALKLGAIDILRYLDLVAQLREYEIAHVQLMGERWEHLMALEALVGTAVVDLGRGGELPPLRDVLMEAEMERN